MPVETTEISELQEQLEALAAEYVAAENSNLHDRAAWDLATPVRHGLIVSLVETSGKLAAGGGTEAHLLVEKALVLADWQEFADRRCPTHTFVSMRACGCAWRAAADDGFEQAEALHRPRPEHLHVTVEAL